MDRNLKRFLCFKCDQFFFSSVLLLQHIKFSHPYLSQYQCKQSNCLRTFQDLKGLQKHFSYQHLEGTIEEQNLNKFTYNENHSVIQDKPLTNFDPIDAPEIPSSSTSQGNDFFKLLLGFVSKLYNNSSVNRSVVQDILTYTKNLQMIFFYL